MRKLTLVLALLAGTAAAGVSTSEAAPLQPMSAPVAAMQLSAGEPVATVQTVQYRRYGRYHRRHYFAHRRYYRR